MKKLTYIIASFTLLLAQPVWACDACQKQQPKILQNVAHGAGPQSNWDYVIVWSIVIITLLTLFFSVKYLVKPGERSNAHIKHALNFND
jgi:hypothetical protein